MYRENGLLFPWPYQHNFSQELHQLEEYCKTQKLNASMSDIVQFSAMSEYDFAAEGDLFKAPEPIIEESEIDLDPMTAAISMISCDEDIKSTDISILQNEQLLSDVFYECKKDLLEMTAMESPLSEIMEIKIPLLNIDENTVQENRPLPDMPLLPKSISSGSLSSMDWMHGSAMKPALFGVSGIDFDAVYGMRRSLSEGDIKTLGNGNNVNAVQSSRERPFSCNSEERLQKLSRYRNKKTKRNFGRKIKYACRKALADTQPRIRGRFAKNEECEAKRE
ncbi:unnamed protein product [Lathyrus sativus]|nr:unnamed protein product [Lathyrus sativus]